MESIKFIDLIDLINKYLDYIDVIKDKHISLFSELSFVTNLDTNLYLEHVKKNK